MARRVLVTRPEPGATATASRLRDAGFEAVVLPLSHTLALPVDASAVPASAAAVAITSANAVRHIPAGLLSLLAGKKCLAVGARTALAARKAGFQDVVEGPGDAIGLADLASAELPAGAELAYLTGRVRLPDFERRMALSGHRLAVVETYDTVLVKDVAVPDPPIDAVLLYSAKAAQAFSVIAKGQPGLQDAFCVCLSERVAGSLQHIRRERVFVSADPTEDALMMRLKEACALAP